MSSMRLEKNCENFGHKLVYASGDLKAGTYLAQRVINTIQLGNAVSLLGTMPQGGILEGFKYLFVFIIAYGIFYKSKCNLNNLVKLC